MQIGTNTTKGPISLGYYATTPFVNSTFSCWSRPISAGPVIARFLPVRSLQHCPICEFHKLPRNVFFQLDWVSHKWSSLLVALTWALDEWVVTPLGGEQRQSGPHHKDPPKHLHLPPFTILRRLLCQMPPQPHPGSCRCTCASRL